MHFLLFTTYLILFSWLVTRIPFVKKTGLPALVLAGLFILKVVAGCLYGWVHTIPEDYAVKSDTWMYYFQGLRETDMLLNEPLRFFGELFHDPYNGGMDKMLSTHESYWNDLKSNIMLKLVGIFNLLTFNHYYSNVILINFLSFFGPVAIYRCFRDRFTGSYRLILVTGSFLIPSALFWTSGLHKEGLLLTGIGLSFFYMNRVFMQSWSAGRILAVLSALFLLFVLRNHVVFALLPALLLWWITEKYSGNIPVIYVAATIAGVVFFFVSPYIHPDLNLPEYVRVRNEEFKALGGNTAVDTEALNASPAGFLRYLPGAIDLAILRPHPGDGGTMYIPFTLEVFIGCALVLLALFFPVKYHQTRALKWSSIYFSLLLLLLIGYTVNNIGAIIRYRSLALPFLFLPMLLSTDFNRIKGFFRSRIHK